MAWAYEHGEDAAAREDMALTSLFGGLALANLHRRCAQFRAQHSVAQRHRGQSSRRKSLRSDPETSIPRSLPLTAKSVYRVPRPIRWEEGSVRGSPFDTAAWAAAAVEIELDPWTLEARPIGVWLCIDGGEILQPERAASAMRIAASDALGACMRERVDPTEGPGRREDYFRYGLVPLHELPPIAVAFVGPPRRSTIKGIGELPFNTIPAAYLSALSQAEGRPFHLCRSRPPN